MTNQHFSDLLDIIFIIWILLICLESFITYPNMEIQGNELTPPYVTNSFEICRDDCAKTPLCMSFSYYDTLCFLKDRINVENYRVFNPVSTSGSLLPSKTIIYHLFIWSSHNKKFPCSCLVAICQNSFKLSEPFQYFSAYKRVFKYSTPDECCSVCYYNSNCYTYQLHKVTQTCTVVFKDNIASITKIDNSNYNSGAV